MTLLVSNLDLQWTDDQLAGLFAPFGPVGSAKIAMDGFTGGSRGFGYVEMEGEEEARKAISALNGSTQEGRVITVEETKERKVQGGSYKVGSGAAQPYRFRKN